jgi:hypothetical protein
MRASDISVHGWVHLIRFAALHAAATLLVGVAPAPAQQVTTMQKNYTIVIDDDVVVRRLHPGPIFDGKGKPRKPTAAELKEMKGNDPKLKGYKAELSNLKAGQVVTVTIARAPLKTTGDSRRRTGDDDSSKPKKPAYKVLGEYTAKLVRAPAGARVKPEDGKKDKDEKDNIVVGFTDLRLPGQPLPAPRDKTRLPPTLVVVRIIIIVESDR